MTEVHVSTASLAVMSAALLSGSDCETVEPQSCSLSRKRQALCVESQEGMNDGGTSAQSPPASRRKIMPPTPQQSRQRSIEAMQLQIKLEDQEIAYEGEYRWTARDRVVIARQKETLLERSRKRFSREVG